MSSSQTKTEFLEAVLDIRTPDRDSARWLYWLVLVSSSLVVISTVGNLFFAESARDTIFPAVQLAFWLIFFEMFFGQGLCIGAYGRAAGRLRGFGRKLRLICTISLAVVFPFLFASMGGDIAGQSEYGWTFGALVGGGIGLAFLLILCGRSFYLYRKIRDGSSAGS